MDLAPMRRLMSSAMASKLINQGRVVLARAPGRLDVMGGIADYSGSLVCEMPIEVAAGVVTQLRDDLKIECFSQQTGKSVSVAVGQVLVSNPLWVRKLFSNDSAWARYPVGCVWWLLNHKPELAKSFRGANIVIDSDVPLGGGVSSSAAIEVATLTAMCKALDVTLEPLRLAVACQEVENKVVGAPCGVMDQVTSCMGDEGALLEILCQAGADGLPAQVRGNIAVPKGYAFIGIHSGVSHEVSGDPYTDTRVAAFMGQKILSGSSVASEMKGHLANLSPAKFDTVKAQLPEQITGRDFLAKHGNTNDTVTTVQPDKTYNVRAATTHPIMENDRVTRFIAELRKPASDASAKAMGELMYGSHTSYSECANLGHAMTDKLVDMVRQRGPSRGFFGAKITGGGGGGTVAILIKDAPEVRAEVERLREQYSKETGRKTMLFQGSSPGSAAVGAHALNLEFES